MKMSNILGGVASSAVIVAMAVVYSSAPREALASVDPTDVIITSGASTPGALAPIQTQTPAVLLSPGLATSPRPRPRPVPHLPDLVNRDDQQYCLAQNIYFEARGESRLGQEAVAWVTLNRVMDPDRPKTICAVVWEPSQFSWTNDGLKDSPRPGAAWEQAQAIAADVTARWRPDTDPTQGSVMFHASGVNPDWSDDFSRVVRIDGHIFYNQG